MFGTYLYKIIYYYLKFEFNWMFCILAIFPFYLLNFYIPKVFYL